MNDLKNTILLKGREWDDAWEESETRSPQEKFENVKRVAKIMGCLSDNPHTIKSFMKHHFQEKRLNKEIKTQH